MAGVRIHDYTHPHWKKDVDILVGGAGEVLAYITIPKSTSARQVAEMIGYIREAACEEELKREIPMHVLVETHGALHDAWEIAALAGRAGARLRPDGFRERPPRRDRTRRTCARRASSSIRSSCAPRREIVAAALAHGVVPAHNVSLDLKNPYNVFRDAWRARNDFGFLRMWCIHPSQIQPIVDAMKPDLARGGRRRARSCSPRSAPTGARSSTQGELHDRATYRYFWELLQKAKVTGVAVPEDAADGFLSKLSDRTR